MALYWDWDKKIGTVDIYNHNVAVKNDTEEGAKILDFVEAFAQKLRENNVLYKAA